jgi:hypothetical protein
MRNLLVPFLALLAIVFVSTDTAAGEETLVNPSVIQPFEYSPDLFPILPWDVLHGGQTPFRDPKHGLESIADCNFTFAQARLERVSCCRASSASQENLLSGSSTMAGVAAGTTGSIENALSFLGRVTRPDKIRSKLPDDFRHLRPVRGVDAWSCAFFPTSHVALRFPLAVGPVGSQYRSRLPWQDIRLFRQ